MMPQLATNGFSLTPTARKTLTQLVYLRDRFGGDVDPDREFFQKIKTLSKFLHCNEKTVRRALTSLRKIGIITTRRAKYKGVTHFKLNLEQLPKGMKPSEFVGEIVRAGHFLLRNVVETTTMSLKDILSAMREAAQPKKNPESVPLPPEAEVQYASNNTERSQYYQKPKELRRSWADQVGEMIANFQFKDDGDPPS